MRTSRPVPAPAAAGRPNLIAAAIRADLDTAVRKDPASRSRTEALLHAGVHAVWLHRVAHHFFTAGHRLPARALAYGIRLLTGVDVHPGAKFGQRVFIDHGAAVVIGETAELGDDVMIYHHVTIGSVGWWRAGVTDGRRHPRIGRGSVLCTGASVLGPITVGEDCLIGAHAVVLADVPDGTRVGAAEVWRGEKLITAMTWPAASSAMPYSPESPIIARKPAARTGNHAPHQEAGLG
jgi:serine O-acetyltransferase